MLSLAYAMAAMLFDAVLERWSLFRPAGCPLQVGYFPASEVAASVTGTPLPSQE